MQVTGVRTRFDASADRPLSVQLALLLEQLEVRPGALMGGRYNRVGLEVGGRRMRNDKRGDECTRAPAGHEGLHQVGCSSSWR